MTDPITLSGWAARLLGERPLARAALTARARRLGAPRWVTDALERLPEGEYRSARDVEAALGYRQTGRPPFSGRLRAARGARKGER